MRQFISALFGLLFGIVTPLADTFVVSPPDEVQPGEGIVIATLVDDSFHFGETNITTVNDIEFFPDGRIAYGGIGRFETIGISGADGEVVNTDSAGFFLTNVLSLAVDPIDRVIYSAGEAAQGEFSAWMQKSMGWDDVNWSSLSKVRGRANKILGMADRTLLIAGRLQVTGDTNTYGLVRLNLTGNLDPNFFYETSADMEVTAMEIMADGSILAAFQVTNENQLLSGYYRWESNGVRPGPPIPIAVPDSRVTAMARMPGTNLVLLAHEEASEGATVTRFSWVTEFGAASGPAEQWPSVNGKVHAIAFETIHPETAQEGGYDRVLIAGEFSRIGTNECNNLATLNKDGSVAWCFSPAEGPDSAIRDVEVQLNGKVLIAGAFTNVSGVEAKGMARIHGSSPDGVSYLYWADSDYAVSEKTGTTFLRLERRGNLHQSLKVSLTAGKIPPLVSLPQTVTFGSSEEVVLVPVGSTDNSEATGRRTMHITATTTNANVILTRETTTVAVLDDETAGTFDPTYQPAIPAFRNVFGIQEDGKIIFGGYGTGLTRVNPDGSLDPTFVQNGVPDLFGGEIRQILPQPDGKIYVAGSFSTTNSAYGINHVARVNADGTLDRKFDPRLSRGTGSKAAKILVLKDGDVAVWLQSGLSREGVAGFTGMFRMDPNGRLTSPLAPLGTWTTEPVWEISETDYLITYGDLSGSVLRQIADLDTFPIAARIEGRLFAMDSYENSLLLGGNFTLVHTNAVTNLAQLDLVTGLLQTNFHPVVNGTVHTVKVHQGKIYISGDFTEVNGQTRYRIARLNLDGTLDADFNPGFGPNRAPGVLGVQIDGSLIVGNGFGRVDGIPAELFVRLEGDPRPGEIRLVSSRMEVSATNEFITVEVERVGGSRGQLSTTLSTVEGSALAGQHFTGTNVTITYLDGEFGRKFLQIPLHSAAQPSGRRTFSVVAGDLPNFEETTILILEKASRLIASATADGSTNTFRDIAADTGGWVYAVGSFTNVNGADVTNIVRLDSDLVVDETFRLAELPALVSSGTTNHFTPLNTVAVNEVGIAIGGLFNLVGTNDWASVVRIKFDGTYDETFNTAARIAVFSRTFETRQLLYQPDGRLVLSLYNANSKRLETDGTLDGTFYGEFRQGGDIWLDSMDRFYSRFNTGLRTVARYDSFGSSDDFYISVHYQVNLSTTPNPLLNTLAIQPDDKIILGGAFTHVGSTFGQPATPRLARVLTNHVVDTNFVAVVGTNTPGSGPKNGVTAIQSLPDGSILIGGLFDVVNGQRRTMLALLNTNGELRNDFKVEVVGEQIDQFALLPDGDVIVRGKVSSIDGVEVGELFKLSIPDMQAPIATFLWPTNGAEVRISDIQETIQVHAFDPDGFVEKVVLEINGQTVATNNSGNVPFQLSLPTSGEHQLRLIVMDDSGLTTSETITFQTVEISSPQNLTITTTDDGELLITYEHGLLLESTDLETWTEVDRDDGEYRTAPSESSRFYRATAL